LKRFIIQMYRKLQKKGVKQSMDSIVVLFSAWHVGSLSHGRKLLEFYK
jgi:Na+/H+ antiporter NhaC